MNSYIICKKCGNKIEISEAISHQLEEEITKNLEENHKLELIQVEKKTKELIEKKLNEEAALKLKIITEENDDRKKRNIELEEHILKVRKDNRLLEEQYAKQKLELEEKLLLEKEKISSEVKKKLDDEYKLKEFEKDKKISDQAHALDELKKKLEQGSQQMQGEVLELTVENELRKKFIYDEILEVGKGVKGGDIIQILKDKLGNSYGTILWELKNARWSDSWLPKLRDDQRQTKADIAILVSTDLPKDINIFTQKDGVWISSSKSYLELAYALHYALYRVYQTKGSALNKSEKMEDLYSYITGNEFKQRIEGIMESYARFKTEIERERKFMEVKWARQEKELHKFVTGTLGLYGELQAVTNSALPQLKDADIQELE